MSSTFCNVSSPDRDAETEQFAADVHEGLAASPKRLPSKYFYDRTGSELFDDICELPEYYLTRTELAIMAEHVDAMAAQIGPATMLVELGSGSSTKTRLLLDAIERPTVYVPLDISREHLLDAARRIAEEFDDLEVVPVHADFGSELTAPDCETDVDRRVVYFPGSTIGNFRSDQAAALLSRIAKFVGPGGGMLIGFDLEKPREVLEAAYNDSQDVTASFNKNLLHRINRELDGNFDIDQFEHRAVYNSSDRRIEMHLVSESDQQVEVAGEVFEFTRGESIRTELSHKYRVENFRALAQQAGMVEEELWTDPRELVAVAYYRVPATS